MLYRLYDKMKKLDMTWHGCLVVVDMFAFCNIRENELIIEEAISRSTFGVGL